MPAPTIPEDVLSLLARFAGVGEVFCVGGCVRDALRGVEPNDWDLCTSLVPEQTLALFSDLRCIPTGLRHGTVTILTESGRPVEITTYRVDGAYADHRRPNAVTFSSSLAEDCARRDFTVNAMAYHPDYGLIDYFGGQEDLSAHRIRCVGDPDKRFDEDALRMLRAVRFAACLGFSVDAATAEALHKNRALLAYVARERITAEFYKLLAGRDAADILCAYADLFAVILPCCRALSGETADALRRAFAVNDDPTLRLSALLLLCGAPTPDPTELVLDNETRARLRILYKDAAEPLPTNRPSLLRSFAEGSPAHTEDRVHLYRMLHPADADTAAQAYALCRSLLAVGAPYTPSMLQIRGDALSSLGYRGREIGEILHTLLESVIDGTLPNTPDALITAARSKKH